ncbi:MAG: Calx-beta domain-containing protein [Verrucomicrobiota bacterium]
MNTTLPRPSGITRIGACIIATLGLGIASALATPTVKLNLGGKVFGKDLEIDASSGTWHLSASKAYSYKLLGTCTGTGALANVVPPGTPISTFLNFLKPGSGSSLSGVYDNPSGDLGFVVLEKTYTGTKTLPSIGAVTLSAKITGGTSDNGEVYLKVDHVTFTSASPTPLGTIVFDSGAQFVVSAAPQIQFNAAGQPPVSEGAGSIKILVTRYGNTKGVAKAKYTTVDGTASSIGNKDFTAQSGTVTFGNKVTKQFITIPITDTLIKDKTRKFTVVLSTPNKGTVLGTKLVNTVAISDNE